MLCSKIGYTTFREAQRIINLASKKSRWRKNKVPKRSYKCPDCGLWHLTSKRDNY